MNAERFTSSADPAIEHLHARFVEISKRKEPVRLVAHLWRKILAAPEYNGDATALDRDARFIAWYLRKQIDADKRMPGSLRLKNLLQEEQFFADLAEAQERHPSQYAKLNAPAPAPAAERQSEATAVDPSRFRGLTDAVRKDIGL